MMMMMMMMFAWVVLTILGASTAAGGQKSPNSALSKVNSQFALNVYRELSRTTEDNIFVSPLGISFALGLVSLGARGNTSQEIRNALQLSSTSRREEIHKFFRRINAHLFTSSYYDLHLASNIFVHQGVAVKRRFLKKASRFYSAAIQRLDFKDSTNSARLINGWISEETKGKIKDFLTSDEIGIDKKLLLANAVYFRADWDQKFDRSMTKLEEFHVSDGETTRVAMMHSVRMKINHAAKDQVQAVELPYYKKKLSMIIVKPRSRNISLDRLERRLTSGFLNSLNLREEFVTVSIPRFRINSEVDLTAALGKIGIESLFDARAADLGGISDAGRETGRLHVTRMKHKAVLEVGEEGSEAAATTGVLMTTRSEKFSHRFLADSPFLFLVRDNQSGLVLFIGRVVRPENFQT